MLTCRPCWIPLTIVSLIFSAVPVKAQDARKPVRLSVDLREATKHIFHAKLAFPATAGPLTLVYPKWIPGEHSPVGPIVNLTGVLFRAGGKEIVWRRDDVDMFAFHCQVPAGVSELEVSLDYVSPIGPTPGRENPSATAQLALLNWYTVLVYPQGAKSDDLTYTASLQIPAGWKYGTALPVASETGGTIEFQPASLTTLVDSPVLMGAHVRVIDLSPGQKPEHHIHIAAESEAGLEVTPETVREWKQLVAETGALFGARHYRHYDFLLTESDNMETDGVEHNESSDNRVSRSKHFRCDDGSLAPRIHAFMEREISAASRAGNSKLSGADEGQFALGLRRNDAVLRDDAFGANWKLDAGEIAGESRVGRGVSGSPQGAIVARLGRYGSYGAAVVWIAGRIPDMAARYGLLR
jgi:hypothetical protein